MLSGEATNTNFNLWFDPTHNLGICNDESLLQSFGTNGLVVSK